MSYGLWSKIVLGAFYGLFLLWIWNRYRTGRSESPDVFLAALTVLALVLTTLTVEAYL